MFNDDKHDITDISWQLFARTGCINYYLFRNRLKEDKEKQIEKEKR